MKTADFQYELPPELIAQQPAPERSGSRLLVLPRRHGAVRHLSFSDFPSLLRRGDLLILNDSRVMKARLRGENERTGGQFELLLLEEQGRNEWWAMVRPGKRARPGTVIRVRRPDGGVSGVRAEVRDSNEEGHRRVSFSGISDVREELEWLGEVPLPPYIERGRSGASGADAVRYQTVYAREAGSVAAPTAGLHFTEALLGEVRARGVEIGSLTLHVGLGTFAPVKVARVVDHPMHEEAYEVPAVTAAAVNRARREGRRVVAVGTTTVRVLESVAARHQGQVVAGPGRTRIFIYPPYRFGVVDALLTNFHLPQSTLLMLVSAFAAPGEESGRALVLSAYAEAVARRYRFFSYGDAMFLADEEG